MAVHNNCKDCSKYIGNCGKHFRDSRGHICYEIPSETYMDNSLDNCHGSCFEPSEHYLKELKAITAIKIADEYSLEEVELALEILKVGKDNE